MNGRMERSGMPPALRTSSQASSRPIRIHISGPFSIAITAANPDRQKAHRNRTKLAAVLRTSQAAKVVKVSKLAMSCIARLYQ